jgi:hypothetical protein
MHPSSRAVRHCLEVGGVLLVAACGSSDPSDTRQAYENAPQLSLVEEVRYCADEDLPECQLTDMVFATPAQQGGVIIGMPRGPFTRFDSTGGIVARYGRQGGGPGEYAFVQGVHVEPDGRVVLQDFGQSRRVVYAPDGTPLVTQRLDPDFGIRDLSFGPHGFAILRDPPAEVGDSVMSEVRVFRDTLPYTVAGRLSLVRAGNEMGMMRQSGFFQSMFPLWAIDSDSSILLADGPSLRIVRIFRDGRSETVVDAPSIGNRKVTSEDISAERAKREKAAASAPFPLDPRLLDEQEESAASHHRFGDRLVALSDGVILLRENVFGADSGRWTMFHRTGEVIGRFLLPAEAYVRGGTRDRLLVQSRNDLGVPIIAWHRVQPDAQ